MQMYTYYKMRDKWKKKRMRKLKRMRRKLKKKAN